MAIADARESEPQPTWGSAMLAGIVATFEQPAGWPVALAGFLARGGILLFLLPILSLPTPAGLQARLAPLFAPLVLGLASPGLVALVAAVAALAAVGLLVGSWLGGWAESVLVRGVAADLEDERRPAAATRALDVAVARLLAHLPLAAALTWAAFRIGEAAYRELVTPFEVTTPLAVRILSAAPEAIAVVVVLWLLGEAAGSLAARDLVLGRRRLVPSVLWGWARLARRPLTSLGTAVVTTALLALATMPGLVAATTAWGALRGALYEGRPGEIALALALFIAIWLGSLVLAAVAAMFGTAAWTAEWLRGVRLAGGGGAESDGVRGASLRGQDGERGDGANAADRVGTIVGHGEPDRGGWSHGGGSGTL